MATSSYTGEIISVLEGNHSKTEFSPRQIWFDWFNNFPFPSAENYKIQFSCVLGFPTFSEMNFL